MNSYYDEFDYKSEIIKEIEQLKRTIQIQQEAVNAAAYVIDNLRDEIKTLKDGLYLRDLNNEIAKYKNLWHKASDDYIKLSERYEQLMSKYIKL